MNCAIHAYSGQRMAQVLRRYGKRVNESADRSGNAAGKVH
jgi:hypothetical protein